MTLYPGVAYEYSAAAAGLLFTAGACPLDEQGNVVGPGDLEAQATAATENLVRALEEAGASVETLLKTTIYVVATNRDDLVRVWNVASACLGRTPSTLLGVSLLGYPEQLVEVEAIAALPGRD